LLWFGRRDWHDEQLDGGPQARPFGCVNLCEAPQAIAIGRTKITLFLDWVGYRLARIRDTLARRSACCAVRCGVVS
jgi:hypothetical protein